KVVKEKESEILEKFSKILHSSKKKLKTEYFPFLKIILKNKDFLKEISSGLKVEKEDLLSIFH
ncbi:MAG: hypothetical protein QXG39_05210, partial [Candidatus Aenigmatarchaeota archaeon]